MIIKLQSKIINNNQLQMFNIDKYILKINNFII